MVSLTQHSRGKVGVGGRTDDGGVLLDIGDQALKNRLDAAEVSLSLLDDGGCVRDNHGVGGGGGEEAHNREDGKEGELHSD